MDQRIFKADIQLPVETIIKEIVPKLIETAVTKSQIAIIDMMMGNVNATDLSYLKCIRKGLVRNLDHAATTEVEKTQCEIQGYCSCVSGHCLVPKNTQADDEIWGKNAPVPPKYLVVVNLSLISDDFRFDLKKKGYTLIEPDSQIYHELIEKGELDLGYEP